MRIAEDERPVGARGSLLLVGGDEREWCGIDAEARLQRGLRKGERRVARQARTRPRLGQRVAHRAHRALVGDRDAPFLGAFDDVAAECRVAHFPHRRREDRADEAPIRLGARFPPDELVPCPLLRIVARELDGGKAMPLGAECYTLRGQRGIGGRDRLRAVDGERRDVGAKRRCERPCDHARDPEHRQRTLECMRRASDRERCRRRAHALRPAASRDAMRRYAAPPAAPANGRPAPAERR